MSPAQQGLTRVPLMSKNIPTPTRDSNTQPVKQPPSTLLPVQSSNLNVQAQLQRPKPILDSRALTVSRPPPFALNPIPHAGVDYFPPSQLSPQAVTTPKKRAVPHEEVHVRNVPAYSPSKRSRSSKSGTGSSTAEPSTGTTTSLANDLSGVRVADSSRAVAGIRQPAKNQHTSHARPTTTRINRRLVDPERLLQDHQAQEERELWRQKFRKAFPSFRFYFDSFDEATAKGLTKIILHLGGSVDQFFSRSVTHLITTRIIPLSNNDRNDSSRDGTANPSRPAAEESRNEARKTFRPSFLKSRLSPSKSTQDKENAKNRSVPLFSERNPFDDWGASAVQSNDILIKAQAFGIKIWRQEKLKNVLTMLLDKPIATQSAATNKQDLSQMLEREKLYGTSERDPKAARGDFHYFPKGNYYLLVEDATMEHRPIMCMEYEYAKPHEEDGKEPPWPMLHGELEGRCPFTKHQVTDKQRLALTRGNNSHQTLRRAVSLNNMAKNDASPASMHLKNDDSQQVRKHAYPMASGNSIAITSNIASTTSTVLTDQAGAASALLQNRRVAELGRRMHTPFVHSPTTELPASPASIFGGSGVGSGLGISADGGAGSATGVSPRSPFSAQLSRGAVVRRMLGMTEHDSRQGQTLHPSIRRSVSTGTVAKPAATKKPGYCENCRIKYDHFFDHIQSRKHRKFANDDAHFVDIDELLLRMRRPMVSGIGCLDEGEKEPNSSQTRQEMESLYEYDGASNLTNEEFAPGPYEEESVYQAHLEP